MAIWGAAAICGFAVGRLLPPAREKTAWIEALLALIAAFACGAIATALDFGGWAEPDWRAALFAFLGTLLTVGLFRLARLTRRSER